MNQHLTIERINDNIRLFTGNEPLTEGLMVLSLPLEDGTLLVEVSTTPRGADYTPRMSIELNARRCPQWLGYFLGSKAEKEVEELLDGPNHEKSTSYRTIEWEELSQYLDERLVLLARFAQGLWIRRYWPASKVKRIRKLNVGLLELELVSLGCNRRIQPIFSGSYILELLASPIRHAAVNLGRIESISKVPAEIQPLCAGIVHDVVNFLADTSEDHDAFHESSEDIEQLIEDLDEYLEGSLADIYGRAAEPAHLGEAMIVDFGQLLAERQQDGYQDLDLAANGQQHHGNSGQSIPDLRVNQQAVIDAGATVSWQVCHDDNGSYVRIRADLCVPQELAPKTASVIVLLRDTEETCEGTLAASTNAYEGSIPLPNDAQVEDVDIRTLVTTVAPARGEEREKLALLQAQALRWALARADLVNESAAPLVTFVRGSLDLNTPWLAEIVAQKDVYSYQHCDHRTLGLVDQ